MSIHRTEGQPHDRLTELANAMIAELERGTIAPPDGELLAVGIDWGDDVKAVVMLQDGERGGICIHGYDDDTDAMADLLMHLRAIFEANGKTLLVAPLGGDG